MAKNKKNIFAFTQSILESISDGVFTVDPDWNITFFNRAAEKITGLKKDEALGKKCYEVLKSSMCETDCALRKTLDTGSPILDKHCFIVNSYGKRIPITISTAVLKNNEGEILGGAETFRDMTEIEALRKELKQKYSLGDLKSQSASMKKVFDIVPVVAESPTTVFINGETGTGKELLARAIHNYSPRKGKPFVTVNCAAIPDNLLESELFGFKAGAFTGANRDKPGKFKMADKGTIFIDEIGELSPAMQIKLLRVIQEREIEPLGSVKTEKVDVRIITSTNRNLEEMVENSSFRQDLYYRINVIKLDLPPLRKRLEDIPILSNDFIERLNNIQCKNIKGIRPEVFSVLKNYSWPGNVRELENVIEHAYVICGEDYIKKEHLPAYLSDKTVKENEKDSDDFYEAKKAFEKDFIERTLRNNNYNRSKTIEELGIHKSTFFRKIKELDIPLPELDGRKS